MRARTGAALLLAAALALVPSASATAAASETPAAPAPPPSTAPTSAEFAEDTVLVRFRDGVAAPAQQRALASRGVEAEEAIGGGPWQRVDTGGRDPQQVRDELASDGRVAAAELDLVRRTARVPNDPDFVGQDALRTLRLPEAWDVSTGSPTTIVAILDTGVDRNHPDLRTRLLTGRNFVAGNLDASDDEGHGTAVAGAVAASTNNGIGTAGVDWSARILPVKVLGSDGAGTDSNIAAGIRYAADSGARIINLSLGGPGYSSTLADAVAYALSRNVVVVAAAGNSGDGEEHHPAALPGVLTVASTDDGGRLTFFSSSGPWVDVAAPGWRVLTPARGGQLARHSGTSYSTPLVSGVAGLLLAQNPTWTPAQVRERLRSTARDAGPRGVDPFYGAGLVDAASALGAPAVGPLPLAPRDASDPADDTPAGAVPLRGAVTGTLSPEGDVDWTSLDAAGSEGLCLAGRASSGGPQRAEDVVTLHDSALRPLATSSSAVLVPRAGRYFASVRNRNGSAAEGTYRLETCSAIEAHHRILGGGRSVLGERVLPEAPAPDGVGRKGTYQRGVIYWHPALGPSEVFGAILSRWQLTGSERGSLGYPTTGERVTPDRVGRFNHFQRGSVYWTPGTGAQEVRGAIRDRWTRLGWETGPLGYPTTGELGTPDRVGRFNHFQRGSIYWAPVSGAHEVRGAIRDRWARLGWEQGRLGYPTSGEYAVPGGRASNFQGGRVTWNASTGETSVWLR